MAETEAIVLRAIAYGEADVIATLLGAEGGKIRGMARGARKSRRRFGAGLDPGNRGVVSYRTQTRSELANIEAFSQARPPRFAADPLLGFAVASVALEVADALSVEDEDAAARYAILNRLFDELAGGREPEVTLALNLAATLGDAGFAPTFDRCVRCRRPLGHGARFDASRVGSVCGGCTSEAPVAPLEGGLAARIAHLDAESTDIEAARAACAMLGAAAGHLIGRPIRSLEFLRTRAHA